MPEKPTLYGIKNSNRKSEDFWGKNQFNSSFPVALACYMRDKKINAVYLRLNEKLEVEADELPFSDVFNTTSPNSELYFSFESKFEPYQKYSHDDIGGIDLVVMTANRDYLRPFEVKLTVIPDNATAKRPEEKWGSEIVFRPATTKYCALGIIDSLQDRLEWVREMFEPSCHDMQDWGNGYEISRKLPRLLDALDELERGAIDRQKPFLMQPIWKTEGKSPHLAQNALDVFIWSDLALSRLFLDASKENIKDISHNKITRQMRSAARMARFFYHASTSGMVPLKKIYTEMAFGKQTDKEFAVNGTVTAGYMKSSRRIRPIVERTALKKIILNGGEKILSPERRFDQTVYFTIVTADKTLAARDG